MEKQQNNTGGIDRRSFLKRTALAGAAMCIVPTLERVNAAERTITGKSESASSMASISKQRTLGSGSASFTVSAMGFGCMGLNYHRSEHPNEQAAIRLVHEAIDRGVTLFDTAESYGPFTNERLMGKALKGYTHKVNVTTKFGHKYVNGVQIKTEEDSSPANIRKVCENSLRSLGVESIAMFYQHRSDPNTPIETVAETVAQLIKEGKVQHFGLCEVNADTIRRAHAICPITAIQSEYHLMHRTVEDSVLPLCRELGIGFVPYSPINRGFLGGLINEYTQFSPNDNRQTLPRFQPEAIRKNLRIVEVLNSFGRTRGYTPAQIALAWLMHKGDFIVPIPGTTKLSHLEENLRAADITFTAEEMQELEAAVSAIPVTGSRYDALQESKVQN